MISARRSLATFSVLIGAFVIAGCSTSEKLADHPMDVTPTPTSAVAVLSPTQGNSAYGIVTFSQVTGGVKVSAEIHGLTPGKHGFHIHEYGDCSAPDATSAGGHFSPSAMQHGAPNDQMRHEGDLGNIVADSSGVAAYEWVDAEMSFSGPKSIIGRGVIVHVGEDDLKSQPTGAAGARAACGVVGIAK